jgi:hypothetical protein
MQRKYETLGNEDKMRIEVLTATTLRGSENFRGAFETKLRGKTREREPPSLGLGSPNLTWESGRGDTKNG